VLEPSGDAQQPLRIAGESQQPEAGSLVRYVSIAEGRLWQADVGLRQMEIDPKGAAHERWAGHAQDVFDSAPQRIGDVLFTVRRKTGQPGLTAAALRPLTGATVWETHFAVPLTDAKASSAKQASAP